MTPTEGKENMIQPTGKRFELDSWIIEVDAEAGSCYVYLKGVIPDGGVAFTNPGDDDDKVNLDYDGEGNLLGVEILR